MPNTAEVSTHYRTCHLCEAMCGLEIKVENRKVVSIVGDKNDVHSKGHICPKALGLKDLHEDPNRLKFPVKKTPEGWQQVSWEEAFDMVEHKIKHTQKEHGKDGVGIYMGNPYVHNTGTLLYAFPFHNALGTKNKFASHSLDSLPYQFVAGELFGHQAMFAVPDIGRTDYFMIIGGNPMVSNGSIMSTPHAGKLIKGVRERGGKVVVIDPRRTRTAALADEHHFIRPGSDVLLLLALLQVIFEQGLDKPSHVREVTDGLDTLRDIVQHYTPEKVAPQTGIDADTIRTIAIEYASAEAGICYGRLGISAQAFGGTCHWLMLALSIVTGNLDKPGGMMFTTPAMDFLKATAKEAGSGRYKSRVRGLSETGKYLPTATMAEEILTEGDGQIKTFITVAGNPVLSAPNGKLLDEAFEKLDFYVAVDIYINETTRHADLILPPAFGLEVMHFDFTLFVVSLHNFVNFSGPVIPLEKGMKYDWQILWELHKRLETNERGRKSFKTRIRHWIMDFITPERRIDIGLKIGPYGKWGGRLFKKGGLSLKALKKKPHGITYGALKPCLPERLFTKNKRINIMPDRMVEDLERVKQFLDKPAETNGFDLLLIGRRHLRSNNSWMHNSHRLVKGPDRCTLQIHPEDAKIRGIKEGQMVKVSSRIGTIQVKAEITDEVMPGVISLPHGWGHDRKGVKMDVAQTHAGVSVNDITDHSDIDELTGTAVLCGVPVAVA